MSITSVNFVLSQFETENYRYFIIYDDENQPVFVQNDLVDKETAIAKLRTFFKENNGYFSVRVFGQKLTNSKNLLELDKKAVTRFNIELTTPLVNAFPAQQNGMGMIPNDDPRSNAPNLFGILGTLGEVQTQMKLMEKDHVHYREIKDLEAQLQKAQEENGKASGMSGVLSALGEQFKDPAVLMGLLSNVNGLFKKDPVMPMNGVNSDVEINIGNRRELMINSVNLLMKLDSDFPENVSALANMAQNKPETYKMAVGYLKNI